MRHLLRRTACDDRGFAGLEFAMIVPVLLILIGGVADFALAFWSKGLLASSVAQGAQYAFLKGTTVLPSSVQGIVRKKLSLPAAGVTIKGPDCYCVSGMPAIKVEKTCGQKCPDETLPNNYIVISASYTYEPILPLYSKLASTVLVEAATVRLR